MTKRSTARLAAALAASCALATAASATDWKYTSWTPPSSVNNAAGTIPMFETIEKETNGEFHIENFMGAQLFNNRTTLAGVKDGVADAGVVVPAFTPQELKHAAIITDAVALFTDEWVTVPAANEALLTTCTECQNDFKENNTLSLGVYGGGNLNMLCAIDINSVDDLKGLKMAGVSSMTARWADHIGASRQQISPADLQIALERRQVDCAMSPIEHLETLALKDVVKTIVDRPLGSFPAIHLMIINRDSWAKLPREYKELIIREMPGAIARSAASYYQGDAKWRGGEAEANGIKIVDLPELDPIWDAFVQTEKDTTVVQLALDRGVPAEVTQKVLQNHLDLLVKWRKIMDERGRTPEALAEAMWDEIYSKIDPDKL